MSIRGTAGYHLSGQNAGFNPGAGPSRSDATNDPSPLDAIRQQTSKIEDWLDTLSEPVKPYLPAIGRFLIVVTFLEDALRILTQWSDQLVYLHDYRHSKLTTQDPLLLGLEVWDWKSSDGMKEEDIHLREYGHTLKNQWLTAMLPLQFLPASHTSSSSSTLSPCSPPRS
jgi:hypothetical protein